MLYHFELQMAGVILLTAMAIGGISLLDKTTKREKKEFEASFKKMMSLLSSAKDTFHLIDKIQCISIFYIEINHWNYR